MGHFKLNYNEFRINIDVPTNVTYLSPRCTVASAKTLNDISES